jgi:hypothetical protein
MDTTMMDGKKFYEKEYATKGTANTALGLSIGALAWEALRGGNLNNLLGGVLGTPQQPNPEETAFGLYKGFRDSDDKIIAKHNEDSFALYKYSRDGFDAMQKEISDLKTKLAVAEAVQPWKDKSIYDALAVEAERRQSADCSIVGYSNCTFIPQYIADITPAATSTPKVTYNPLNCLRPTCGC